ncbi:hypothetical protein [Nocardioides marmoraquaticus]
MTRQPRQTGNTGTSCPVCGKRRFTTRRAAKKVARRLNPGQHMNVYRCGEYYHFGHIPSAIRHGAITRDDYRPRPGSTRGGLP